MKKLLAVLLLLPTLSFAQQFRFSIHGGFNPKTSPYLKEGDNYTTGARIMLSFKHTETGLSFEAGWYHGRGIYTGAKDGNQKPRDFRLYTKASYYSILLLENYKFKPAKNFELYAGGALGIDIGEAVERDVIIVAKPFSFSYPPYDYSVNARLHGMVAGLQIGSRYKINKTFSVYGELAARSSIFMEGVKYMSFYFPITVGVSARLF